MTSREFILIWQNFLSYTQKHHPEELERAQQSNEEWRKILLGGPDEETRAPLADYIKKKHFRFARYKKKYLDIDLAFAIQDNVSDVLAVNTEDGKKEQVLDRAAFIPRAFDLLLEHENDIEKCHEKMLRLINLKSKLKVLITYNWEREGDETKYNYMKNIIGENFHKIINQSNQAFPENSDTEYLLIVGYKNDDNEVSWNFYIYNIKAHAVYTKYQPI